MDDGSGVRTIQCPATRAGKTQEKARLFNTTAYLEKSASWRFESSPVHTFFLLRDLLSISLASAQIDFRSGAEKHLENKAPPLALLLSSASRERCGSTRSGLSRDRNGPAGCRGCAPSRTLLSAQPLVAPQRVRRKHL